MHERKRVAGLKTDEQAKSINLQNEKKARFLGPEAGLGVSPNTAKGAMQNKLLAGHGAAGIGLLHPRLLAGAITKFRVLV